jgi:hypothetical protein
MELDKAKLQEVVEKIAYQQTAEDQADDLFNKMGILNKYVQEQLTLTDVVQAKPEKVCKGSWQIGNNCKTCKRCLDTKPS